MTAHLSDLRSPWRAVLARTLIHIQGFGAICEISLSARHIHEDKPGDKARHVERQMAIAALITATPTLRNECEATADFLERLAEHLEASDMPGQAGNCTIRAKAIRAALHLCEATI